MNKGTVCLLRERRRTAATLQNVQDVRRLLTILRV